LSVVAISFIEAQKWFFCRFSNTYFCITDNAGMEPAKKPLGRPRKPSEEKLEQRSIRLTPAQWAKIEAGGLAALRKLIDRWRLK
jgi:hypothetical protein